jgi:hypothetical protein
MPAAKITAATLSSRVLDTIKPLQITKLLIQTEFFAAGFERRSNRLIVFIDLDHDRVMISDFRDLQMAIADYDYYVADLSHSRRRTIQTYLAGTLGRLDSVGNQPLAGIDIQDMNLFVWIYPGRMQKLFVNCNRTLVIQFSASQPGPMDF